MKTLTTIFLLSLTILTQATPSRQVATEQHFLGSSTTSFATIRTVTDNKGSYYISEVKTYLDIHPILLTKESKPTSTLLLHRTHSVQLSNEPKAPEPIVTETHHRNTEILIADLYEKYSTNSTHTWPKEKHETWSSDHHLKAHGVFLNDLQTTKKALFGNGYSKSPITIDKIQEHAGSLYVTLSNLEKTDESEDSQFIIHIPKIKARQLRDRAQLKPIYLSTGTHQTLEEARTAANALTKLYKANKNHSTIEIWSSSLNHEPVYQTVLANSTAIIRKHQTRNYESKYNIQLDPIPGGSLQQKFPLIPIK